MPSPLRHRAFLYFLLTRLCAVAAGQMISVAIGWQVYARTGDPLALGFTGLAQFVTIAVCSPIAGDLVDRFDRRRMMVGCYTVLLGSALALAFIARHQELGVTPIYGVLALLGVARGFWGPTGQALLPALVPQAEFPRAVAFSSAGYQVSAIGGPALAGILIGAIGEDGVFLVSACLAAIAVGLLTLMPYQPEARAAAESSGWSRVLGGVRFVKGRPVILGAISLDLFAVLFGGAVALMPIYAKDILHVGGFGLGLLRSAPALGAGSVGLFLAFRPIRQSAGQLMFVCVAIYGLATISFGLSTNFLLSLLALVVLGAADMVSMVIRQTVVQISTPPEMRGRVAAVNMVFIGASNELGELESGASAAWLGTVPAVVAGGVGTLLVTVLWAVLFPALRKIERPEG